MKDGSLLIHSLASFNFTYRNLFQNGANDMSKMVDRVNDFLSDKKLQILCSSDHPILFKFQQFVEIWVLVDWSDYK